MWSKDSFWLSNDLGYTFVKGGAFVGLGERSLRCFYFLIRRKIEIQSVGKVLVVVVIEQSDGSLVLRKDYHEGFCKWGETQMIVGVYDLDHLKKNKKI